MFTRLGNHPIVGMLETDKSSRSWLEDSPRASLTEAKAVLILRSSCFSWEGGQTNGGTTGVMGFVAGHNGDNLLRGPQSLAKHLTYPFPSNSTVR